MSKLLITLTAVLSILYCKAQSPNIDWRQAPNSYIFDPYSSTNRDGLKIPMRKAYEMRANDPLIGDPNFFNNSQNLISASLVWQDVAGMVVEVNAYSTNPGWEDEYMNVAIDKTKGEGNALVALHFGPNGDETDPIIWSWHIWVTDSPGNDGNHTTSQAVMGPNGAQYHFEWMDRNLGATSSDFVGHEWAKSNGLVYQWGRKDPIPPMAYKDGLYYDVYMGDNTLVSNRAYPGGNHMDVVARPFGTLADNLIYAIEHPFTFIHRQNIQAGSMDSWYAPSIRENSSKNFDLWSDNFEGNIISGYTPLNTSPTYQGPKPKSPYDPCPCGYRVPSHMYPFSTQSRHSPWGRGNSQHNTDQNSPTIGPNASGYPDNNYDGIKIYPALGIDFGSLSPARDFGRISLGGKMFAKTNNNSLSFKYSDFASETNSWTASMGHDGARMLGIVNDPMRIDIDQRGLYSVHSSAITGINTYGMNVRCVKDVLYTDTIPEFESLPYVYYLNDKNFQTGTELPNSYIIPSGQYPATFSIPILKAFAMSYNYLDRGMLPTRPLTARVEWTDNPDLVYALEVNGYTREDSIIVHFGPNQPKGNAVISLLDKFGNVEWSWHIWAPYTDPRAVDPYQTESTISTLNLVNATKSGLPPLETEFMDRDLGALHTFPSIASATPNATELSQIKHSGGLLYQWGRKDPFPTFRYPIGATNNLNSDLSYSIWRQSSIDPVTGVVSYTPAIDEAQYLSSFAESYSSYFTPPTSSDFNLISDGLYDVLAYSCENPATLLYHDIASTVSGNYEENIDWISSRSNLMQERWGHGTVKSPFDPCPEGWRIPDVSFSLLMVPTNHLANDGQLGTSPWFYGDIYRGVILNQQRYGLPQDHTYSIDGTAAIAYPGDQILRGSSNNKRYGWQFDDPDYAIGNYPATGYKLMTNGNNTTTNTGYRTALWTASLADHHFGKAIALEILSYNNGSNSTLKSGTHFPPQSALSCRCAKIKYDNDGNEIGRYDPDVIGDSLTSTKDVSDDFINKGTLNLKLYPNPSLTYISVEGLDKPNASYNLYDIEGRLVDSGKLQDTQIQVSQLSAGTYLLEVEGMSGKFIKK